MVNGDDVSLQTGDPGRIPIHRRRVVGNRNEGPAHRGGPRPDRNLHELTVIGADLLEELSRFGTGRP
jgi:hypothetical protein